MNDGSCCYGPSAPHVDTPQPTPQHPVNKEQSPVFPGPEVVILSSESQWPPRTLQNEHRQLTAGAVLLRAMDKGNMRNARRGAFSWVVC